MNADRLFQQIMAKRSFLCVGLDTDMRKIPECLKGSDDPQFEFNKAIVDATAPYAVCYKPNLAFYEENGAKGWESFEKTCRYIRENHPDMFIIADAKRCDIGNTADMYARAFYKDDMVDAVTLSPYMGRDSVEPFLKYEGKWAVVLALTSNPGSEDFQALVIDAPLRPLFGQVLKTVSKWGTADNLMFVVGATKAAKLKYVRRKVRDHFLLVPGVGAQGGSLRDVAKYGMNKRCGLLVNSSRGIIYAGGSDNFAVAAADAARAVRDEMNTLLKEFL